MSEVKRERNNRTVNEKARRPLNRVIIRAFIPMLIITIIFVTITAYVVSKYHRTNRSYTDAYYEIAKVSASMDSFDRALSAYSNQGGNYYYERLKDSYVELQYNIQSVVSRKMMFINEVRFEIGELGNHIDRIEESMEKLLHEPSMDKAAQLYDGELGNRLADSKELVSVIIQEQIEACQASADSLEYGAYVCYAGMIISLFFLIACFAAFIIIVRIRITKPIEDIEEWARMFRDDYCQMSPLKYNKQDEIQQISDSFNIVRDLMRESQRKNEELQEALETLKREQDDKKAFVQKLYNEKRARADITNVAQHDGLTGLYNRRTFDDFVDEFVIKRPGGKDGALFIIDMDYFKSVNDTLGHMGGDEALKMLAGAMRVVFPGGYLGRYGGDEFIAFVIDCYEDKDMESLAKQLCRKMNKIFTSEGNSVQLSVSIGAASTKGIKQTSELYMRADKALYYSKENGRNRYTVYSEEL